MNQPLQTLAKLAEAVGVDYSAINSDDMIIQTAEAALALIERLRGIKPELPPYPGEEPHREDLPRYGLRWNGPAEPLATPMLDGYWTPYHMAAGIKAQLQEVQYNDGMPAQKAFWEGFERGVMNGAVNIRAHWNEYKQRVQEAVDE